VWKMLGILKGMINRAKKEVLYLYVMMAPHVS
jgi:hypothetical protein